MDIGDIDLEEFSAIIINELQTYGVKYRKPKTKKVQKKSVGKKIFCTNLHLLALTEVILSNGRVVEIPQFVAEACNRILEHVSTEGIFRKAGSFVRQKEIRESLEAGLPLGKSHHVIDVANVIKYFFRELPEPLIPLFIQDALLESLLVGANSVKAIMLACLLLPTLTVNTLSFFMQFLYTVSLSESSNKMSVENLAIIFTPGLMPFPNVNSLRFANHVKIIRILIENANAIGTIPRNIELKLHENLNKLSLAANLSRHIALSAKKGKKRHSEIFYGLRKIVGTATGSSECLDNTVYENNTNSCRQKPDKTDNKESKKILMATPCVKESKKRTSVPFYAISAKKKGTSKKSRLNLPAWQHIQNISVNSAVTSTERKCSILESGHNPGFQNYNLSADSNRTEHIQTHNERVVNETSRATEKSIKLDINRRRQIDQPFIRSPNSAKMRTTRRISQDKNRLSRNYSWHTISSNDAPISKKPILSEEFKHRQNYSNEKLCGDKNIQKPLDLRMSYGVNKSEPQSKQHVLKNSLGKISSHHNLNVQWVSGEDFFSGKKEKETTEKVNEECSNQLQVKHLGFPVRRKLSIDDEKTPILSPKPTSNIYIKISPFNNAKILTSKLPCVDHTAVSTPENEETNGRTSIARLRAKNAGAVLAKAKLFDDLENHKSKEDLLCFNNVLLVKRNDIVLKK